MPIKSVSKKRLTIVWHNLYRRLIERNCGIDNIIKREYPDKADACERPVHRDATPRSSVVYVLICIAIIM